MVGPVHAGVIEPGRFTFDLHGEHIRRVRIQLGYKTRGMESLFTRKPDFAAGVGLAEAVSGDTSVGHGLAYCRAVEAMAGIEPVQEDNDLLWHGNFTMASAAAIAEQLAATRRFVCRARPENGWG